MGREINSLFWAVTLIAFVVGIFVEALLVYTILKYRADRGAPESGEAKADPDKDEPGDDEDDDEEEKGENKAASSVHPTEHGNPKVELAIFAVTAAAFAMLVVVSWTTLFAIESPPEGAALTIDVTAHQWAWEFYYPAEDITEFETVSEMHVPVNTVVKLNVDSTDVLHAIWIPDLGVKIDAVPGTTNHFWFNAEREGRYLLQCAEFCGGAHSNMHATVVAESNADFQLWVAEKRAAATPPPAPLADGDRINITLRDGTIFAERSIANISLNANVTFHLWNNGTMQHSFAFGAPYNLSLPTPLNPGESVDWSVVFNLTADNATYSCPIAGHAALGMQGTFSVAQRARIIDFYLFDPLIPGSSYRIEPASIQLTPGEEVQFRATNNGSMPHNLYMDPPYEFVKTPNLNAGESGLTPSFVVGRSAQYFCAIPGHREDGMEGTMIGAGEAEETGPKVPGFEGSVVVPALALAGVAFLWRRDRLRLR